LRTLAARANLGVYYAVPNQLEVTNPGAAIDTIQIDTGAALVDGQHFYNDAAVTFTVPRNKANDLIVVRKNFQAAAFTPVDNLDPDEIVPAYTTRITRLDIAGGDAFTQSPTRATYGDITLADITAGAGGAITINSDDGEYVDAETKRVGVRAIWGYNSTDVTDIPIDVLGGNDYAAVQLPDNKIAVAFGEFVVPNDFISTMIVSAIIRPQGTGNVYNSQDARIGACGQLYTTHPDSVALAAEAVTQNFNECVAALPATSVAVGDIMRLRYARDAVDALDTVGAAVDVIGFEVEYFGWR